MDTVSSVLQTASPFVALLFTVMWLVNRILAYKEKVRGDPQMASIATALSALGEAMSKEAQSTDTIVQGLTRIEAVLLQNGTMLQGNSGRSDPFDPTSSQSGIPVLSLRNQKLMIEYQWAWCRDEFNAIIAKSIKNNGIGQEGGYERIARRVVQQWHTAAKDACGSLDRLEGMDSYRYKDLFDHHAVVIMRTVWQWAQPLYHRDLKGITLEQSLEDLKIRITQLFESEIREYLTKEDDPDTGRHRRETSPTGEFGIAETMAAELSAYSPGADSAP